MPGGGSRPDPQQAPKGPRKLDMAFPPAYNGFSTEQGVTMALSQSQKIIAFLEKHRGGSFTARQIAEAIVQQYASDYAKKRNNPRFADDKAFLSQIIAEIGSQKDTLKRLRPTLVWQDRPKPRRYCIPLEETQEARDTAQGETCERDEESCACEERTLLEQELYPLLASYLWSELHLYSMRIREGRSHNTRGNGGNQWLHPDIVAMEPVDKAWGKHVKACGHASGSTCVRLWSFEVKKTLTVANIRKCFFQAVSSSSWAHEGISSPRSSPTTGWNRAQDAFRPCTASGLSCSIRKSVGKRNPAPRTEKPDADWQSIDRLAKKNEISTNSLSWFPSTSNRRCRKKDWDNKTAWDLCLSGGYRTALAPPVLPQKRKAGTAPYPFSRKAQQPCAAVGAGFIYPVKGSVRQTL